MKYLSGTRVTFLSFIIITLLFVHPVAGQVKKRLIPFPGGSSSYEKNGGIQLELIEIKVAGRRVILGQPFDADENWLKNMVLRIKNISNKPIIALLAGGGLVMGIDEKESVFNEYGLSWKWGKEFDPEKEKPKGEILKPGEIIELSYVNVDPLIRKKLAEKGEGTFCKLILMYPGIQYADGSYEQATRMRFYSNGEP